MPKAYEPGLYEDDIYKQWEESGVFQPENLENTSGTYCNVLPPPNANGELHLGHVSGYVAMDLMGRYQRMLGKKTLLLPGKDHAGIQTQVVYEKKIKKERNISRHNLGREKFYNEIYDFCIDRSAYMRTQEKKIGLSADWSREKFTMDPKIVNNVLDTFVKMYNEVDEDGNRMIYRGERIINWCPRCASALADVEVEHEEQKAKLFYFKYDKNFPITIATTRPETKLGDTAIAVNPKDERYKEYIGKTFQANFCGIDLNIKIITDHNIDLSFGAGALGVTPGHSAIDWQMAQVNDLEIIKVIGEDANIRPGFGEYSGKSVLEAREMIVAKLKEQGLIEKEEEFDNNLSVCERCKTAIEPLVSEQWFVNVDHKNFSLKKEARKVIENGEIKIYPERYKDIMLSWIDNVHDWCISRQIWWGPRIPAWYREIFDLRLPNADLDDNKSKIENRKSEIYVGIEKPDGEGWMQDSDTFDTWFSSGQWAYNTLGFPEGNDYKEFYPSDTMIMGRDILPFWAFRMIILSIYRTKQIPFKNLYFTGLIRDGQGKKMSKSKGNGIEPLEMIEKFGTDAVRLSMMIGATPGNDMNLSEEKIAGFRNLVNKLWNVARFAISDLRFPIVELNQDMLTVSDRYILEKMKFLIREVSGDLEEYRFSQAGEKLREFTWNDLADWYIEASKFAVSDGKDFVLIKILTDLLKLWHPFIPFVTEAIWQELDSDKKLIVSRWPLALDYEVYKTKQEDIDNFEIIKNIIIAIRNARSENKVEPARKVKALIVAGEYFDLINDNEALLKGMRTGVEKLEVVSKKLEEKDENETIKIVVGEIIIYLFGAIDKEKEAERIKKEKANLEKQIEVLRVKLGNKDFVERAPEAIVKTEQERLLKMESELVKLGE
ncbi:MAG: Valine-tRNA ligase [Candidatus Falkowbacteria bacterium GW2011_GWC2_38_22]|uniref:Valine--tRNA ligase n=1 Tax=Candidatus Falkowbacteria bacterium GW2011_GWE1_38_31 TaxID=1618638 RepID=A0A0G0K6Y3_9BACT|nr:MAG: Valine-tRNA ligase [Candidatus Falkowbacteria bacterium GW2011_GWF2_38_1205]KKQ61796.1 MAG: Valine-tRNA ligase [Candidatus Falkowbacteria bacterium GW2011_GWC2_38_22]KKQ64104.1 MAG: Valine-tRNA ligase [Candidatus Falkowbacteria bacterium GW2011_GWF1_38_22]KKQ66546.1 MAG: Valine-tRNA ligase [Candidatus Falkowbacteria bacterium GW2011_GWE2_38_254]KKQ71210.1 MAG: Valine-tRNA ligase [Candidatus Falkowbacteria bacterium GW2011_GWE1_38_31]KKQ73338.1 MAG: Valine-tRNA ligase [Candidatus Falkow